MITPFGKSMPLLTVLLTDYNPRLALLRSRYLNPLLLQDPETESYDTFAS